MPPISSKDVFDSIGEPSKDIDKVEEYNNIIFWSFDLNNYKKLHHQFFYLHCKPLVL